MSLLAVKWLLLALLVALGLVIMWLDERGRRRHSQPLALAGDLLGALWLGLLVFVVLVATTG